MLFLANYIYNHIYFINWKKETCDLWNAYAAVSDLLFCLAPVTWNKHITSKVRAKKQHHIWILDQVRNSKSAKHNKKEWQPVNQHFQKESSALVASVYLSLQGHFKKRVSWGDKVYFQPHITCSDAPMSLNGFPILVSMEQRSFVPAHDHWSSTGC